MSSNKKKTNNKANKSNKVFYAVVLVAVLVVVGIFLADGITKDRVGAENGSISEANNQGENKTNQGAADNTQTDQNSVAGEGITITKSEITQEALFVPYQVGNTKMEVIAVKASDGTIRTALNTCQVCNNSGYGYYVQEGDELVCQNCGNRFNIDQVEKQRNGCNPVPVDEKTDDGTTITISDEYLSKATPLFKRWKA